MRVAVVGCGVAGLITLKLLMEESNNFEIIDVFEKTNQIGGTWIYTEDEFDKNGLPVHSSMYYNLRTNLPKQLMEFSNFPFHSENSYVTHKEVLKYLKDYANYFDILKFVQFEKLVENIKWQESEKEWIISVKNLRTKEFYSKNYDAVFVCNGHYQVSKYPSQKGMNIFKGHQIHSHYYRKPDKYIDKIILIIGNGFSGQDIIFDVAPYAKKVFFSKHSSRCKVILPDNVIEKPDVKEFQENTVEFVDGTSEYINSIIYCTGYYYSYPFLDESCQIVVNNNYIKSLYKHVLNANHPTMVFIGIPFITFIFRLFETQVMAVINLLTGKAQYPSEVEMKEYIKKYETTRIEKNISMWRYHSLDDVRVYINELCELGRMENPIKEYEFKIYYQSQQIRKDCLNTYRNYYFEVINDNEYSVSYRESL